MSAEMIKPLSFEFNGAEVYNADDVRDYDPNFFYGCSRGIRKIIERKKIDASDYTWGVKSMKTGWNTCLPACPKGKLLLKTTWVHANVPKMAITTDGVAVATDAAYEYEEAPPVLDLEDCEKFTDTDGKTLDIEVRGERDPKKCFFLVKDVSKAFQMDTLKTVLMNKHSDYKQHIHYKTFTVHPVINNDSHHSIHLYLTYTGMLRVLFCSRTGNAERFQEWATEKLFALQMGTVEQKQALVSDALGVTIQAVREVFKKSATSIPCVYLFSLGTVKELREVLNIDPKYHDDDIVYKYGMTKDLARRSLEHQQSYGKIPHVNLKMKYYSFIDPQYISEAETYVNSFFDGLNMNLEYKNHAELVVIPKARIDLVHKQYTNISNLYAGHVKDFVKKIVDLEKELLNKEAQHKAQSEITEARHATEIMRLERDSEILKKDLELSRKDSELLKKDLLIKESELNAMKQIRDLEQKLLAARGIQL